MTPPHTAERLLGAAVSALDEITRRRCTLDEFLDRAAPPELRRTLAHLLLNFFRHRRFVDGEIDRMAPRPPRPRVRLLLAAALTQVRFQSAIAPESAVNVAVTLARAHHAEGFVNALLRRELRELPPVPTAPETVLPEPVLRRWRRRFSAAELAGLTALFLAPAPFSFRAEKDFVPDFPCESVPAPGPFRFYRTADPEAALTSPALAAGRFYVQDPATALAPSLGEPERALKLLDLCAAPGGKSLMLAERMRAGAQLTAADRSARRQEQTRENFRRRKLEHAVIVAEPQELCGTYDYVLADLPCSNTGVFRRRPDALWRFEPAELAKTVRLQRDVLDAAARLVSPDGRLVLSTCSLEPEEDQEQLAAFLERHPDFTAAGPGTLLLPDQGRDGAFAGVLTRRSSTAGY